MRKILLLLTWAVATVVAEAQNVALPQIEMSWKGCSRRDTTLTVWRGERVCLEAVLNMDSVPEERLMVMGSSRKGIVTEVGILGDVLTDDFRGCGKHPGNLEPYTVKDRIQVDSILEITVGEESQIWCSVDVPVEITPGRKYVELRAIGEESGRPYGWIGLHLNVLERALPDPHDYRFHVDFWQQPYSVSRYYGLNEWSDDHLRYLMPYMKRLARSGQKVVTAILFYEPWGDQSHDKFSPMVQTTLRKDSTWTYNYRIFDKWVEMMAACGIDQQIDCYSMVPWDMNFRYWDEARGEYAFLKTKTTEAAYDSLWTSFLKDFAVHLKKKGWFDKTCIAMDERGMADMMRAYDIAQKAVPGIKMALAGNYHRELVPLLHDYCISFRHHFSAEDLEARRKKGQFSTFYTCCSESYPNIFTNSDPVEATYLPLYGIANGFDGYLHWSWMNWADDPANDSRFRLFSPGDTYCIYPDNCPSRRWEKFIEGVQMTEKVRILRDEYNAIIAREDSMVTDSVKFVAMDRLDNLNAVVDRFRDGDAADANLVRQNIEALKHEVNE